MLSGLASTLLNSSAIVATLSLATVVAPATCNAQAGAWSQTVSGVRGRLVIVPQDSEGRPQIRVDLELENLREVANNVEIWWSNAGLMLDFQLEDEQGTPIAKGAAFGNEAQPFPTWLILPHASALRVTLFPVGLAGRQFRLPNFQEWDLSHQPTGTLCLRATFKPRAAPDSANVTRNRRPWIGPLALPCAPLRWTNSP
jgi:hypothetical protein